MAVTAKTKLDAAKLRADFPIFGQEIRGKPLAYLDSAVSAHKPRQVLDKLRTFYETSYANVHRGVYTLSEIATAEYEGAREKVAQFVNAPDARELIFTRGATESINLVAYAWGLDNLGPGDVVVVTELEHHSNFVPWQYIAKRTGAELRMIPLDDAGELDLGELDSIAGDGNVKVVANNLVSNALGTINPIERLSAWAHERGALMVVDGAQAAPHRAIDVQALGCDFFAFSAHKMCGPTSVGALWGRDPLLRHRDEHRIGMARQQHEPRMDVAARTAHLSVRDHAYVRGGHPQHAGDRPQQHVLDAGLPGGGDGHRVPVAAHPLRDPEDVELLNTGHWAPPP